LYDYEFNSQAVEASMSRLWGHIHFKEDVDNGFKVGQQIGKRVVEDTYGEVKTYFITIHNFQASVTKLPSS
jgi:hypothetical protein